MRELTFEGWEALSMDVHGAPDTTLPAEYSPASPKEDGVAIVHNGEARPTVGTIILCARSHLLRSGLREMAQSAGITIALETTSAQEVINVLRGAISPTAVVLTSDDLEYVAPVIAHHRVPIVLVARTLLNGLELVNDRRIQGLLVEDIAKATTMAPLLREALQSVTKGYRYVASLLLNPFADTNLSPREREVLTLVARGHTIAEMRAILNCSRRTLDTYRQRVATKIGHDLTAKTARAWIEQWWVSRHRAIDGLGGARKDENWSPRFEG